MNKQMTKMTCEHSGDVFSCVCVLCGTKVTSRVRHVFHQCGDAPALVQQEPASPGPSLLTKAANFAKSAAAHVAAGMPRASDEEIERRFAICQGCEFYDGRACTKCGCPVVRESRFVSKLAWANEACPVGKWGPEVPG